MSRGLVESDLGSVVGNPVKPQTAFTFRAAEDEEPFSSIKGDDLCNKAEAGKLTAVCVCKTNVPAPSLTTEHLVLPLLKHTDDAA